jgi:DNA-binding MarR family transcriptional regulator
MRLKPRRDAIAPGLGREAVELEIEGRSIINDMDTISGAGLARELGTSVPRIGRAVERLKIDARQTNGHLALTQKQAERIRQALGVTRAVKGLTRSEALALAALRSAPFGLVSARAVARRGSLSPTAAARALNSLRSRDLVFRTRETVAAGRAREMEVWRANVTHPRWRDMDPILDQIEPARESEAPPDRVPRHLHHLFWNTAQSQLDLDHAGAYIARRLLQMMDIQGLAWGAQTLAPDDWLQGARARGLDPKVRQLAHNLAKGAHG